jgi:hypothetical protein
MTAHSHGFPAYALTNSDAPAVTGSLEPQRMTPTLRGRVHRVSLILRRTAGEHLEGERNLTGSRLDILILLQAADGRIAAKKNARLDKDARKPAFRLIMNRWTKAA